MSPLRVIAGEAKGRKLRSVPGPGTRPISDRVKESLFSILAGDVSGARVLDLFAGTGSVGIEALSRGAKMATFVDSSPGAIATVRANLEITGMTARALVVRADVFRYLGHLPDHPYDLVYVAPPQYAGLWQRTLLKLEERPEWVSDEGVVVVQMHPKEWIPPDGRAFALDDERRYGSTLLAFFERGPTLAGAARSG